MAQYDLIDTAFGDNVELANSVHGAIRADPTAAHLFLDIASYIQSLRDVVPAGHPASNSVEPWKKKRKLENGRLNIIEDLPPEHETRLLFEARDLSFSLPVRKKLHLELTQILSSTNEHPPSGYKVRARNSSSKAIEYEASLHSLKYALRLPVPEKLQKQYNFVLLSDFGFGHGDKNLIGGIDSKQPLTWTVNAGAHNFTTFIDESVEKDIQSQHGGPIEQVLNICLEASPARKLIEPDEAEFSSATPETHRRGEKAYHVKAFRGSKEGYLFFLATGIFFGFKRPLGFIPFGIIHSISYTSVLQRTFNLSIAVQLPDESGVTEHEFSMLDQSEFTGIDTYVKRHQLHDSSLAESRRAKKLNLNGVETEARDQRSAEVELSSELRKVQVDLEDIEDAEEEDYMPESEDMSNGSGDNSEEEHAEGGSADEEGDLVATELGSEAEEVFPDSIKEGQL